MESSQGIPNKDEMKTKSPQGRQHKAEITPEKLDQDDNRTFHENAHNITVGLL